ncbi:gamma-tubulin complex component 6 [Orussus abietinus]|uniref:gamma-tubulin complex component 6 n=1 Tax=Orussus abietinus TaxID=222816 RepID=UPI000625C999|nr:gamma-tubulin complex component 6 [Orussus abietinus]XP_012273525.1 gamma-tubulin complex component 6 [Orussus abietinus]
MGPDIKSGNIYGLITELCICSLGKYSLNEENPHVHVRSNANVKKLRSKAYAILLNKQDHVLEKRNDKDIIFACVDPIAELLKHIFVLKVGKGLLSEAMELDGLTSVLVDPNFEISQEDLATLRFLIGLKSTEPQQEPNLNIFRRSRRNQFVPKTLPRKNDFVSLQAYPIEAFHLSEHFETLLGCQRKCIMQKRYLEQRKRYSAFNQIGPATITNIESMRKNSMLGVLCNVQPTYPAELPIMKELEFPCYPFPSVSTIPQMVQNDFLTEPSEVLSNSESTHTQISHRVLVSEVLSETWDLSINSLPNYQVWESLGGSEVSKQPPFLSEVNITLLPLREVHAVVECPHPTKEISLEQFSEHVKLLLVGVNSDSFVHESVSGFKLVKNTLSPMIGDDVLKHVCEEAIYWGNAYKNLTGLITPDPQTGKLQQEGLIFKAMSNTIREVLMHHQATVLRTSTCVDSSLGLLQTIERVRPMGVLLVEIDGLCRCKSQEGTDLLTHIYEKVTKVTKPNVAFIYYSILTSCCEVYFRFLEKWLFEGNCDDIYGEFMINVQPHYLRQRGYKFWTKAFGINVQSVPGFLETLIDSILQCGKTIKLLRVCDPKNPLWSVVSTIHPNVKVCLSVKQLREQELYYRRYVEKVETVLQPSPVIDDKRINDDEKESQVVPEARKESPIAVEEEPIEKIESDDQEVLINVKDEEENLQQRDIIDDPIKNVLPEVEIVQEEAIDAINNAKSKLLDRFSHLEKKVDARRLIASWRIKRLELYDKRVLAMKASQERWQLDEAPSSGVKISETASEAVPEISKKQSQVEPSSEEAQKVAPAEKESIKEVKENKEITNVAKTTTSPKKSPSEDVEASSKVKTVIDKEPEVTLKKPTRPAALNIRDVRLEEGTLPIDYDLTDRRKNLVPRVRAGVREKEPAKQDLFRKEGTAIFRRSTSSFRSDREEKSMFSEVPKPENPDSRLKTPVDVISPFSTEISPTSPMVEKGNLEELRTDSRSRGRSPRRRSQALEWPSQGPTWRRRRREEEDLNLVTPMSSTADSTWSSAPESSSSPGTLRGDEESRTSREELTSSRVADEPGNFNIPFSTADSRLTLEDVEILDNSSLRAYLEKSVSMPLRVQNRLANRELIRHFAEEHDMVSHLHSLREFFFLLNGEFARSLTDSIFSRLYVVATPVDLCNPATLTNALDRALSRGIGGAHRNHERLSLYAAHVPEQLLISNPNVLDCLCLSYKISWPLNVVLDESSIAQYSKVFKFLVTVNRVLWVLQEDFYLLKLPKSAANSEQHHKLQLYRHSMVQFSNAVHSYLMCSVLHASWTEFEKDLGAASSLDEVHAAHVVYLKKILSKCMLNQRGEKMRVNLCNVFKIILKFHNRLRSRNWNLGPTGYVHPNYGSLEQMYHAFCQLRSYLARVADKLTTTGYQPHLQHFLNALNINCLFDVTEKL